MKIKTITTLALILSYFSQAQAGTAVSGGGGAFVCRDENKNVTSSMLVDLWESQNTPFRWRKPLSPNDKTNLKININKTNDLSIEQQVSNAINNIARLNEDLAYATRGELNEILLNLNPLPNGISLTIPNDLQVDYFPDNCPPEGMLRYNGYSKELDIKTSIFEKLESNTDVAASYIHEALYKIFRQGGSPTAQNNSTLVRRLVACVFSEQCMDLVLNKTQQPKIRKISTISKRINKKIAIASLSSSDPSSSDLTGPPPIYSGPIMSGSHFKCSSNDSLVYVTQYMMSDNFMSSYDIKKIDGVSFATKVGGRVDCETQSHFYGAFCEQFTTTLDPDSDVVDDGSQDDPSKAFLPQSWLKRFDFEPVKFRQLTLNFHPYPQGEYPEIKSISFLQLSSGTNSPHSKLVSRNELLKLSCEQLK